MKREARVLKAKAVESLILGIGHFNGYDDLARHEAVLILIDRAFELLLKAAIIHKGGRIRERHAKDTIGFNKCVRKCVSDQTVKCLTEEEALTMQIINSLRGAAQHYIVSLSEQELYTYSQAGVTLFGDILKSVFGEELRGHLPERILPVSSAPPKDLHAIVDMQFAEIKHLSRPRSRTRLDAMAKLRALAIVEASLQGESSQPGELELRRLIDKIRIGQQWRSLFPGIAKLNLTTEGTGLNVSIRLTKGEGEAVHLVPEGTPGATIVAVRRVDELGFYSLGLRDLAERLGISAPKTLALVTHFNMQDSPDYYKNIKVGRTTFKRYSHRAVERLKKELGVVDLNKVWKKYREAITKRTKNTQVTNAGLV